MTRHDSFYSQAARYDALFGWRDLDADGQFLLGLLDLHPDENSHTAMLELAAGPAAHARWFARRGLRAHALDCSAPMLDYAASLEPSLRTHLEDMTRFAWREEPVNLAICLLDSLSYVLDHDALSSHLECVADALLPGGIYVIELAHPRAALTGEPTTETTWSVEHGEETLEMTYGLPQDYFDPITQIHHTTTKLVVRRDVEVIEELLDTSPTRLWLVQELLAMLRHSPFVHVGSYGALTTEVAIDSPKAHHAVLILKKR